MINGNDGGLAGERANPADEAEVGSNINPSEHVVCVETVGCITVLRWSYSRSINY